MQIGKIQVKNRMSEIVLSLWKKGGYWGSKRFAGDQLQKIVFARAAGSSDKTKFASARSDESRSYGENTMIFENLYIKHVCWTPVGATQIASHTVLLIIKIEEN